MNGKLSNISKWVFGALALITVVFAVLFFLNRGECEPWNQWIKDLHRVPENEPPTPNTNLFLNWSYISVFIGIALVLISAIFAAIVKGVNVKTILITLGAIIVIGVAAYLMSKGSFGVEYPVAGRETPYSGTTHGLVELGLNFFYITLGVSVLCILFSVIKSGR